MSNATINAASGSALSLNTGAIAGNGFTSTTSGGGTNGIALTAVTGTLALGSGALSGATGSTFLVNGGTVTTTYSGNITQANNAALLDVQGGHTGTLTFSTGTLSATNGTGLQFDNADGTYNLNGTNTLNGGDAGIDILNTSTGTFTFSSNSAITNPTGTSFNLSSSNANVTYSGSISDDTGKAVLIDNHDSGTITFQTGSITSTGTGITVSNSNGGAINFNGQTALTTTTNTAVDLGTNNAGGTINFNAAGNGLDIITTTGTGFLATGGTITVTGSGNSITTTTGTALDLGSLQVGVNGITFATVNTGAAATGIQIASVSQAASSTGIDILGGTIGSGGGVTSRGVDIDLTSADVTVNSAITTSSSGRSVEVTNSGGTVAGGSTINFGGAITDGGGGINLDNNDSGFGATMNFTGGLAISTTTNVGFNATAGGTVNVTGASNTINSASATALNVANTNIGASGLTFLSVSAGNNTAAADPVNGIVLNTTGSSGGLTITGDATTANNASGGLIQNVSGYGISLTSTRNVNLDQISIQNTGKNGINGSQVTNFTLTHSALSNNGTAVAGQFEENSIAFVDRTTPNPTGNTIDGTVTITNNTINQPHRNALMIETWSGTISNINVSNNTFTGGTTTADIQDAIHVFSQGSASTTANITTGTFNNNNISGFEFLSGGIEIGGNGIRIAGGSGNASNNTVGTLGTAANPIEISGNDVDFVGSNAIAVSFNGQQGISNFNIHDNGTVADPMTNMEGLGISVFFGGSGTFSALVNNNVIDNNGPTVNAGSSGIAVQLDDGPDGLGNATGVATIHVNNNTVTNPDGFGIRGIVRASHGTLNLYIQNNNVGTPSAANREAIRVDSGSSIGDTTLNLNITGNSGPLASTTDNLVGNGLDAGIGVRKQGTVAGVNEFNIQGITANPTNLQVQQYIGANNHSADGPPGSGSVSGVDIISGSAYGTTNSVPLLVSLPPPSTTANDGGGSDGGDGIASAPAPLPVDPNGSNYVPDVVGGSGDAGAPSGGPTVVLTDDPTQPPPAVVDDGILTQSELNLIVSAAIERWAAAGATADEIAAMRAVTFAVEDLGALVLASSSGGHITIDSNAAGFNWFVDATPADDSEYAGSGSDLHAAQGTIAGERIDLLTTVMHELGHQIGLGDRYDPADRADLMYGTIDPGERRLPEAQDVAQATGAPAPGTDFALSPIGIGTLPAGQTVTIQWQATINTQSNQIVVNPVNNGTVSATNVGTFPDVTTSNVTTTLDSLILGGTVWNDNGAGGGTANNGVKDGTEPGIDGVLVSLLVDANNDNIPDSSTPIASQLTSGGGAYSFTNLAPGNYIVRIDQDNFDAGGNTSLVNLPSSSANTPDQPDPDDNVDGDDNGSRTAGQPAFSKAITLSNNAEPTSTGVNHANTNTTLDFGFVKVNTAPAFAALDGTPTFTEAGAAIVLDSNATVSDADLTGTNYSGATLTLARSGGASAQDVFGGTGGGTGLNFSGSNVLVGAGQTNVGTFTQSAGTLVITFNASATQALVNSTLQGITYSNNSDNPPATALIAYTVNDGNTGTQGSGGALSASGSVTVSITPTNDAPVATASNHNLGPATEQTAFSLKGAGLSVSDIDGNAGSETVTLAVGQGILNVTAGTSGAGVSGTGTGTVTITGTIAQINALLNTDGTSSVSYVSNSDTPPASTSLDLIIHDGGATGGGDLSSTDSATISINAVNDAPTATVSAALAATEQQTTNLKNTMTVADVDAASGNVTATVSVDYGILNASAGTSGVVLSGSGTATVTIGGTLAQINDFLSTNGTSSFGYVPNTDAPPASTTLHLQVNDNGNTGTGGSLTSTIQNSTVNITAIDDAAVAVADSASTNEDATKIIAVVANDSDPDGTTPTVAMINGTSVTAGVPFTLPSGAKVTLNNDGTLTYDPNHVYDQLTSTAGGETGAVNTSAGDSFTYTLGGTGGGTATVTITVNGVVSVQDHLNGDATDNTITGTPVGDFFDLSQGGNDTATGLGGNDAFVFGATFNALDTVDGGAGTNDQVGLQGNYTGGNKLVMGASTIANIEALVVLPGFSYDITMNDGNVAAGGLLKVQAQQLAAGQSLTFNGAAEHDGAFFIFGGQGNDNLTGGDQNDAFYFGPGAYTSADIVNGGPGNDDQLGLDGIYGLFGSPFVLTSNITNVETIVLLPGPTGSPDSYNLTTDNSLVPAGTTLEIYAVQVTTDVIFDGSHELDGAFKFLGGSGNDTFTGSAGNDFIFGGYGADLLTGGLGGDTFYYDDAAQSTSIGHDTIFGFDDSADTIDLPFAVTGFAAPASGSLSTASFDSDLATAFAGLTSHQAGMFTATSGSLAGHTFLVIDADGNPGYQAGSDYVIEIVTPVTPVDNPAIFV